MYIVWAIATAFMAANVEAHANVEGARFAFAKSGPVDYPEVTMEIGRPVHEYTLRLIFDRTHYQRLTGGVCGGGAHLTLFHSDIFRKSATLNVIEDGQCGRDVVDFSGARWEALLAVVPNHLLPDDPKHHVDRNLYREDPATWPDILIASDTCRFSISSHTILPLSYIYPGTSPVQERFVALVMHRDIWADDQGESMRGNAVKGYNALKIHPHRADNDTIVLAGNVLWGNLGLSIDQVARRAELVTYPHRHDLGVLDIFYLALLSIFYARWLLSGMWLDTCDTGQLYMVMLTNYGLLGSVALTLLKITVGYPLYYAQVTRFADRLTAHHNTAAYSIRGLIALSIAADVLVICMALVVMNRGIRHAAAAFAKSLTGVWREWRSGGSFEDTGPDAEWREHHHHPYVSERLPYRRGRWDPRTAYAQHPRNRPFSWFWPETSAFYALLVDLVFTTAVWFVSAAADDVVITDAITLVTFTVAVYTGMQYTVMLFETLKPVWYSGHWPNSRSIASLALVASATVLLAAFIGRFIVRRMLDDYWTEYHGRALDAVVIFYMLVLLLAAKLMVRHIFSVYIVKVNGSSGRVNDHSTAATAGAYFAPFSSSPPSLPLASLSLSASLSAPQSLTRLWIPSRHDADLLFLCSGTRGTCRKGEHISTCTQWPPN
ncbi:MAG: hypothetical protein LC650_04145 [Actinobacteria bacterium]|nr:hypothetical protein [Actinomycetota bacterium]